MSDLDSDFQLVLDGLGEFIDKEIVPLESANSELLAEPWHRFDETGAYSAPVMELMQHTRVAAARAGYYTLFSPKSIDGAGLGAEASLRTWEFLYHRYGPTSFLPFHVLAHWTSGPSYLFDHLSPRLRSQLLPQFMSGEVTSCFAMSEPGAGSDAWAMSTRAARDGDSWVITGTKQWISNSPQAQYALVFAVTNDEMRRARKGGVSAFLVPTDANGFRIDSVIRLFGHSGGKEAILSFNEVRVPADHLVGELDDGFRLAIGGVGLGRMYNAGRCVGMARWALEKAVEYAKQRTAFGHPISSYQGVTFQLADCAIDIYAAKHMSLDCARRLDRGESARREVAMVKAHTTEMCFQVYDRCMQVMGGMGMTNEVGLQDGWHQARVIRVADGSTEVMRRDVANALLRGDIEF